MLLVCQLLAERGSALRELEKQATVSGGYDKLADALPKTFFTTDPRP